MKIKAQELANRLGPLWKVFTFKTSDGWQYCVDYHVFDKDSILEIYPIFGDTIHDCGEGDELPKCYKAYFDYHTEVLSFSIFINGDTPENALKNLNNCLSRNIGSFNNNISILIKYLDTFL